MKKIALIMTTAASFACITPLAAAGKSGLLPVFLRCEYHENPLGTDLASPSLSWLLKAADAAGGIQPDGGATLDFNQARGRRQAAYQILVASTDKLLAADKGDLWNSGKVTTDQSVHIRYAGKPLPPRRQVHWKMRIQDQDGELSDWSRPATWVMGVLGDWQRLFQHSRARLGEMVRGGQRAGLFRGA